MSEAEVAAFLQRVGLASCVEPFRYAKVDGAMLLKLTREDLEEAEELAISESDATTLLRAVLELKESEQTATASTHGVGSAIAKARAAIAQLALLLDADGEVSAAGSVVEEAHALGEECAQLQTKLSAKFPRA